MQRKRLVSIIALFLAVAVSGVFAQLTAELETVDEIIDAEDPQRAIEMLEDLEDEADTDQERGEIYWRLASATLMLGDQRDQDGASDDQLLAIYEEGEAYGEQAINADPTNPLGYYWKSANIGRWGQTKGVLNSLFRAPDMRDLLTEAVTRDPEHAESYYVLGQLYAKVPGMVSFGNVEYAVSLARKSIDLMEAELRSGERDEAYESFYIQLASHLIDRDWNSRKRGREIPDLRDEYEAASTPIDRGFYYEGVASVPSGSDEDEAESILSEVIERLESIGSPSPSERRQLDEARELIDSL